MGLAGGCQARLKTSSRGRTCCSGCRWQLMQKPIVRSAPFAVSGISSIRPWHEEQPIPLLMWMLWSK